jgi:hypothetical protein
MAATPFSRVPGAPPASAPSVYRSCRVITLLLFLLMLRTISPSGFDCQTSAGGVSGGMRVRPSLPLNDPPTSFHNDENNPNAYVSCCNTVRPRP